MFNTCMNDDFLSYNRGCGRASDNCGCNFGCNSCNANTFGSSCCNAYRTSCPRAMSCGPRPASCCPCQASCCPQQQCPPIIPLPSPLILSPESGQTITTATPVISGMASPNNRVTVCISGQNCLQTVADAVGLFSLAVTTPLTAGNYTLTATQSDTCGNISERTTSAFTVELAE